MPYSFPNGPKYSMSSKAGFKQQKTDPLTNPGPAHYTPASSTNCVRPKTPSWRIGTAKRPNLNPGDPTTPGKLIIILFIFI